MDPVAIEDDELQQLARVCRFVASSVMALLVAGGLAAGLTTLAVVGVLDVPGYDPRYLGVVIVAVPLLLVLGGLVRLASILWGGAIAAGILAFSVPMPLVAPVALAYAFLVTRRRLSAAGMSPASCLLPFR